MTPPPPLEQKEELFVSFVKMPGARTGNILFQYLFAITISLRFGHKYIPIEEFPIPMERTIKLTDDYVESDLANASHIICEGFFQKAEFFVPIRESILEYLETSDDWWVGVSGDREYIRDFLFLRSSPENKVHRSLRSIPDATQEEYNLTPENFVCRSLTCRDIVVSLRLDDFIQLPMSRSDILPPRFYTEILEKWFSYHGGEGRLVIVCDKLRHGWEHKYLEFFNKWSPQMYQYSLLDDFALMRESYVLIHSNSTLCWMASFLSRVKTARFIPSTNTYSSQHLGLIEPEKDCLYNVITLTHEQVYRINIMCDHRDIECLPYSIPDEIIVASEPVEKLHAVAPLVPGTSSDYAFGQGQEAEYYNMYKVSRFALTQKKGGWDCLRHYEILANGAIPIFEEMDKCPADTMASFPKSTLKEAAAELLPWYGTEAQQIKYEEYRIRLLDEVRLNCSCSAVAAKFLKSMPCKSENILLLTGHVGVNYTRELTWIGIKRSAKIAVEWPVMNYLYNSSADGALYGNGFTYSKRLPDSLNIRLEEDELVKSIVEKQWDMIIYGKVGPDEGAEGSLPNLPFWQHVFKRYGRDEIAFWYGGDGMQDMTWENRYSTHLARHCQYARCFVRELIRWNGKY